MSINKAIKQPISFMSKIAKSQALRAFTLAEVLITLGIIGIIAELTIPTLIQRVQNQVYTSQLKKAYSEMQNGLKTYMSDEGLENFGDTELFDGTTAFTDEGRRNKLDKMIRKYFKVIKSCVFSDTSCDYTLKYLASSSGFPISNATAYTFYTADGTGYSINLQKVCTLNATTTGAMKGWCGTIIIDTNGRKAPNLEGRDAFVAFLIGPDGNLYANSGKAYAEYANNPNSYWRNGPLSVSCGDPNASPTTIPAGTSGQGCLPRIMENGWQMDY